jgi:hypothetical protein
MTELSAEERLAALRAPSKKRPKPAHTSKVLSAGISTTALLGLVAAMGWPSGTGSAQSAEPVAAATQAATPAAPTVPTVPTSVPALPAVVPMTPAPAPAAVPVVIPAAVPVTASPAPEPAAPVPSNTTTQSSG